MERLTKGSVYAAKAMMGIAELPEGTVVKTRELAESKGMPAAFLGKLVQRLIRAGLLRAYRGTAGGIALAQPATEIKFREIIEAVDGPIVKSLCLSDPGKCPAEARCRFRKIWIEAQIKQLRILENTTLADLVEHADELDAFFDNHCI